MNICKLKMPASIQKGLILAAVSFSLALTASGQDSSSDAIFPKPLTQTTRFEDVAILWLPLWRRGGK